MTQTHDEETYFRDGEWREGGVAVWVEASYHFQNKRTKRKRKRSATQKGSIKSSGFCRQLTNGNLLSWREQERANRSLLQREFFSCYFLFLFFPLFFFLPFSSFSLRVAVIDKNFILFRRGEKSCVATEKKEKVEGRIIWRKSVCTMIGQPINTRRRMIPNRFFSSCLGWERNAIVSQRFAN